MTKPAFDLKPLLQRLDIATRKGVTSSLLGSYRSVFRGHGLEFDSYRQYDPGDDASLIDWKASRRGNQVLIKQFVEERNLNVILMVDVSESMLLGSGRAKLKIEYAAEISASLIYAVLKSDDSAGWVLFGSKSKIAHNPEKGIGKYYSFARDMVDPESYGGFANLSSALDDLGKQITDHAVVIIISDFINVGTGWEDTLARLGAKFEFIAVVVHDPLDHTLPDDKAYLVLEHPTSGEQLIVNAESAKVEFEQHARAFEASLNAKFKKAEMDHVHLSTLEPFVKPIMSFFEARKRRWH